MCGIAGWVDWERDLRNERATAERMIAPLAKRGPDAEGIWLSERAALAHRRLIVIDPESGQQPMPFQPHDQPVVITFNGEIYNFQELREELRGKGHQFRTRSDTEVILHAYVEWGEDCVRRLNGIFAFAIWDEARQKLFLARDHLGVKPLFYAQRGSAVLFASEIKALFAHGAVRPVVGPDGMAQVFGALRLHVPGATVYKDVFELPAAHTATFQHGKVAVRRYWQFESREHTDDLETTVLRIRELLADTVRHQLVADVPVVTMLSGGLDSSGITALAAREFAREQRGLDTYSIDFEDQARNFKPNLMHLSLDTPWALKVSEHWKTRQHMVVFDADDLLESLMVPTRAHDRPGMGQMETSLYLFCRAIKRDATVALSGESADEVFGGYPWFHLPQAVNAPTFPWMALLDAGSDAPLPLSKDLAAKVSPRAYAAEQYRIACAEVPKLAGESADDAKRRELLYLNQTRFLPILLDRKDRMSMACGLEVRVPFCDYRLVQYVWNIPWSMKTTGDIEKGVLRRALEDVLPQDVLYRRKNPYPASHDPRYTAGVRERAKAILDAPDARVRPFFDMDALRARLAHPAAADDSLHINTPFELLIQIEGWLREYDVEVP